MDHGEIDVQTTVTVSNLEVGRDYVLTFSWFAEETGGDLEVQIDGAIRAVPLILLVDDDDNTPDVRSYYTAALDLLGLRYDVWDTGNSDDEPNAATLAGYQAVLWFTGHEFGGAAGPGPTGEAELAAYLDNPLPGLSSCLFLSSQDYLFDRGGVTSFMTDRLGVGSATGDVFQTGVTGQGFLFGGLGPYTLDYPFSNFSDRISPGPTADLAFSGDGCAASPCDAAISKAFPSKTVFLGFPGAALPTPPDRVAVLARVLGNCSRTCDSTVPFHRYLRQQTVSGVRLFELCNSIWAGDGFAVQGEVTFRTGNLVTLGDGFSVGSGATLVVEVGYSAPLQGEVPDPFFSISRTDDLLRTIDPETGATLGSVQITLAGETIQGGTGLAADLGTLWAILKLAGQSGRELVTVDPATGIATSIGDLGDRFAGLAFDFAGTLYGVTGDGATTPETLYTIDTTDASTTLATTLGNGDDGEAIAFRRSDGLLYHASGLSDQIFETINPVGFELTNVPLSGFSNYREATAILDISRFSFLLTDIDRGLYDVSFGNISQIGSLDHVSKGLARLP